MIAATAVLAYSADRRALQRPSETWAFAFVLGLSLAVLIAWPAQQFIARLVDYDTGGTDGAVRLGLDTLNWVVVPAAVLFAIAIGAALRYRTIHTNTRFGRPSSNRPRPEHLTSVAEK